MKENRSKAACALALLALASGPAAWAQAQTTDDESLSRVSLPSESAVFTKDHAQLATPPRQDQLNRTQWELLRDVFPNKDYAWRVPFSYIVGVDGRFEPGSLQAHPEKVEISRRVDADKKNAPELSEELTARYQREVIQNLRKLLESYSFTPAKDKEGNAVPFLMETELTLNTAEHAPGRSCAPPKE